MKIGKAKEIKAKRELNPKIKESVKNKVEKAVDIKDKVVKGIKANETIIVTSLISGGVGIAKEVIVKKYIKKV